VDTLSPRIREEDDVFQMTSTQWFLSIVLPISTDDVAEALERCRADALAREGDRAPRWSLASGTCRLEFDGAPIRPEPSRPAALWPTQVLPGRLRTRGSGRLRVEVEFWPWSDDATEMGLRPTRGGPRRWSRAAYRLCGSAAIVTLGTELCEWAAARDDASRIDYPEVC
jgi:hypothetical protein